MNNVKHGKSIFINFLFYNVFYLDFQLTVKKDLVSIGLIEEKENKPNIDFEREKYHLSQLTLLMTVTLK